jgi:hypothetical protein
MILKIIGTNNISKSDLLLIFCEELTNGCECLSEFFAFHGKCDPYEIPVAGSAVCTAVNQSDLFLFQKV